MPLGLVARRGEWVEHLYLDPGQCRRGLGTALLDVTHAGMPRVHFRVFQHDAAATAFHARRGLRAAEFTDGCGNEEGSRTVA